MKLRNKKTGDIWEFDGISMAISDSTKEKLGARGCSGSCYARSLSELNEEWEDYKPAEPLIKDERIRKVVRAWAELHEVESVFYYVYAIHSELSYLKDKDTDVIIDIVALPELKDEKTYTIAELCGEEEE